MNLIKTIKQVYHRCNWMLLSYLFVLPNVSHATTIESILHRTISYLQGGVAKTVA